jgi:hypothetical protein
LARPSPGKRGGRSAGPAAKRESAGAGAGHPLPASFRWMRNIGLVTGWAAAVVCGWQAGGGAWGDGWAAPRGDLLNGALRGAAVWLGLTTIWLVGFGLCRRIIGSSGGQAVRRSGVQGDEAETPST